MSTRTILPFVFPCSEFNYSCPVHPQRPIEYTEEELRLVHAPDPEEEQQAAAAPAVPAMTPEERQAALRRLMDTIPTSREGVWSYPIKYVASKGLVSLHPQPFMNYVFGVH